MVVIAGLGNPGQAYQDTRHNLGFLAVRFLARRHRIPLSKNKFESRFGIGHIGRHKTLLLTPLTFMNRSGRAVLAWLEYYKRSAEHLLVMHDDLDLPWLRLRIVTRGGAGGHKGVLSIFEELQSREFTRVRLGIGRPPENVPAESYVLEPLSEDEKRDLPEFLTRAADAVEAILEHGALAAMNQFNPVKKY